MRILTDFYHNAVDPNAELSIVTFGHERCHAGHTFGPAVRDYYLIHFVLSGKGSFTADGTTYPLTAGEGFSIFPGDTTVYSADLSEPWHYYWIGFTGNAAKGLLKACGIDKKSPIFSFDDFSGLKAEFTALFKTAGQQKLYAQLGRLYLILSKIHGNEQPSDGTADKYTQAAVSYIESHWDEDIGVSDIAEAVFIDRSYLYRLFKEKFGVTPSAYMTAYRLSKACELLRYSNHGISDIALYCGYSSASAFLKAFKKVYGKTAGEYRRNL